MDGLRVGNPLVAGDVTFVPVERCVFQSDSGDMGGWLSGLKEPYAIILCDAAGVHAFNMEGTEIPVAPLVQKIPDLSALLAPLSA